MKFQQGTRFVEILSISADSTTLMMPTNLPSSGGPDGLQLLVRVVRFWTQKFASAWLGDCWDFS
jgi:hypothetical protein